MTSPQLQDQTDAGRVPTYEVLPADCTPTGESLQPVIKFAKMYAPKLSAKQGMSIDRAFDATIRSLHLLQVCIAGVEITPKFQVVSRTTSLGNLVVFRYMW